MSTRSLAPKLGLFAALSFAAFGIYVFAAAMKSSSQISQSTEPDDLSDQAGA